MGMQIDMNKSLNKEGGMRAWSVILFLSMFAFLVHEVTSQTVITNTQNAECLYTHFGTAYVGTISTTRSGKSCQSWSSQSPHNHPYTNPAKFPDDAIADASNYCRNPSGNRERGVWCYTTDTATEWEYCDVPYCECKVLRTGHGYLGTHSSTYAGVTCQRWDSQSPHAHSYTAEDFDDFTLADASNYCRNPNPNWHWGTFCLTSSPNIRKQHCSINFCDCKTTVAGDLYEGHIDRTISGKTCQSWTSQSPHVHGFTHVSMFPDTRMEAAGSYCRNPDDNHSDGPWCYTTDPNTIWEACDIPMCEYLTPEALTTTTTTPAPPTQPYTGPTITERTVEENISQPIQECKFSHRGSSYRGSLAVTVTGKTCQAWISQSPHQHPELPSAVLSDASVEDASNKCRNPTMSSMGPWCFTTSPDTRFEYCDVPLCNCKTSRNGAEYEGYAQKTRSGLTCQAWSSQSPHHHEYTSNEFFPLDGSVEDASNYCRNPNNDDPNGPWCLTTDPIIRWEYCGVPYCECKQDMEGHRYQGRVSVTRSGKRCQRWDSQTPHPHTRNDPTTFPEGKVETAVNFCRNPDRESGGPWCYTTDPNTRWEYCDLPFCELAAATYADVAHMQGSVENKQDSDKPYSNCKLSKTGENFRGTMSHTNSYIACQRWDSQSPHSHTYADVAKFPDLTLEAAGDMCRNPGNSRDGPWCFTMDPEVEWEYCPVPNCGCKENKAGWGYNGTKSVTKQGYTCQRWDSQNPHPHHYNKYPQYFPDDTVADASNYCRNPELWVPIGPWCLTTDPNVLWDYCELPFCECKATEAGHDYGGTKAKSKSGRTCQRWDVQSPHRHPYYDRCMFVDGSAEAANNYCRTPDPNELVAPFCYTTDPDVMWEYCDIPMCEDAGDHPLITEHGMAKIQAHAEKLLGSRTDGDNTSDKTTVTVLSVFVGILLVALIIVAVFHYQQIILLCGRAKDSLINKSFDNPLYGETQASAAYGIGTSVKLEVPEQVGSSNAEASSTNSTTT